MNSENRNALLTLTFYVISIFIIVIINVSGKFKSGPCTPNLDVFSVFIVIAINIILLLINGFRGLIMKKPTRLSFLIHLIVLLSFIIIVKYNIL
jgi:hypothetical protein